MDSETRSFNNQSISQSRKQASKQSINSQWIFRYVSQSFCPPVCLSDSLSVHPFVSQSVHYFGQSVSLSVSQWISHSVSPSFGRRVGQPIIHCHLVIHSFIIHFNHWTLKLLPDLFHFWDSITQVVQSHNVLHPGLVQPEGPLAE